MVWYLIHVTFAILTKCLQNCVGLQDLLLSPPGHTACHGAQILENELGGLGLKYTVNKNQAVISIQPAELHTAQTQILTVCHPNLVNMQHY